MPNTSCKSVRKLFICLLLLVLQAESHRDIYVDGTNGRDSGSCGKETSEPCATLAPALEELQSIKEDVTVHIAPGNYTLDEHTHALNHLANVLFSGGQSSAGAAGVIISCTEQSGAGLAFYSSSNISFEHMTISQCGLLLDKSTVSFLNKGDSNISSSIEYHAALSFNYCQDITLRDIAVSSSNGIGVDMWNVNGSVTILNSSFIDNKVLFNETETTQYPGGGGLAITLYGNTTGDSIYMISQCHFDSNNATVAQSMFHHHHTYNDTSLNNLWSKGGGLAIRLQESTQGNSFLIRDCSFENNAAWFGAGLMVQFANKTQGNRVTVKQCRFNSNVCFGQYNSPPTCEGGGVRIDFIHDVYSPNDNTALFDDCSFYNNSASTGGAVSLLFSDVKQAHSYPLLNIINSFFLFNSADNAGSALFVNSWSHSLSRDGFVQSMVNVQDTVFDGNYVTVPINDTCGMGAIYCNGVPISFSNRVTFDSNRGTAIVISGTEFTVNHSTELLFYNNTGHSGGALALINRSWLTVNKGSSLVFESNAAHMHGGAIYAIQSGFQERMYSEYCFLRYQNRFVHPDQWEATFSFTNNTASCRRNSIYTLSLMACVWPSSTNSSLKEDIASTFCWRGWSYNENETNSCDKEIETAGSYFVPSNTSFTNNSSSRRIPLLVYPGKETSLPIKFRDDKGNNLTSLLLSAQIDGEDTYVHQYSSNGVITIYGKPNHTVLMVLDTLFPRVIRTEFDVTFRECPPGFGIVEKDPDRYQCQCTNSYDQTVICDADNFQSYIRWGSFMTLNKETNETLVAPWAFSTKVKFPPNKPGYIELSKDLQSLNDETCHDLGRTGFLCDQCLPNHSSSYSYIFQCVSCNAEDYYINWLFYILQTYAPITVFFLIVVIFNISTTSGPANAFIFFAQVIANPITVARTAGQLYALFDGHQNLLSIVLSVLIVPYGIWNLDFFQPIVPPLCLVLGMKSIHTYALNYTTAFYPLVLISACYILIELHARNVRFVVCLWRPFSFCVGRIRRNWDLRASVVDAFATFLLLSYSKFCLITFYLLVPVYAINADGDWASGPYLFFDPSVRYLSSEHAPFFILALVVLVFVILPPPIFLFLFPTRLFQRLLNRCNVRATGLRMFVESFQGCYKDGVSFGSSDRRFFSSLYFVFRILAFSSVTLSYNLFMQRLFQIIVIAAIILLFSVLRPYKDGFYNKLDSFIFTSLLIVTSIAMYNAAVPNATIWINVLLVVAMLIPLVYMIGYVTKHVLMFIRACLKPGPLEYRPRLSASVCSRSFDNVGLVDSVGSLPDRVINPQDYDNQLTLTRSEVRLNYGSTNN